MHVCEYVYMDVCALVCVCARVCVCTSYFIVSTIIVLFISQVIHVV